MSRRRARAGILAILVAAIPGLSWSFSEEERRFIAAHQALLEAAPDPCRLAPRLEARYIALLRGALPEQDAADLLAVAEGKPGVPLILAEGLRLSGAFALYDDATDAVYLSSASLARRVTDAGRGCLPDERIATLAQDTVGVYVHELGHALERRALGDRFVATSEGEILAYAREARFLAKQPGWPSKTVADELARRRALEDLIRRNGEILAQVRKLRDEEPGENALDALTLFVEELEEIKQNIADLEARESEVDPFQLSLAAMVAAWKDGWPAFLQLMIPQASSRPSVSRAGQNLATARRFLKTSRAQLEEEPSGTLAYTVLERSVALAEKDIRFWGDKKQVARATAFYQRRFKEVRPPTSSSTKGRRPHSR